MVTLLEVRRWQVDSVFYFVFLATEPLLQNLYSRVIWINRGNELFKALDILIQVLPVKVVLASANQEHVFDRLHFFFCELTRSTPR